MGLPKTTCAGDMPEEGSGVFRYCKSPAATASVSRPTLLSVLEVNSRFMDLTATSVLPLDDGW